MKNRGATLWEVTKQEETKVTEPKVEMTIGQKNALKAAESYLDFSAFSYEGLIAQLELEGFTKEQAEKRMDTNK